MHDTPVSIAKKSIGDCAAIFQLSTTDARLAYGNRSTAACVLIADKIA